MELNTKNKQLNQMQHLNDDEIDFLNLIKPLWKKKLLILLLTVFSGLVSYMYSLTIVNTYKSEAILIPSKNIINNSNQTNSSFSGLASFAGIKLQNSSSSNQVLIGLEIMKSLNFYEQFLINNDLYIELQAANGWSKKNNELILNSNLYDVNQKKWISKGEFSVNGRPSLQSTHSSFLKKFQISNDSQSGLIKLSFEHYSPYKAQIILNKLIKDINTITKEDDIDTAYKAISFLEAELEKSNLNDLRIGINNLIQKQIEKIALANSSPEYLFQILSGPHFPESKTSPNRSYIVMISMLISFLATSISILFFNSYKLYKV
jgi:capsular polysaccharide biosynthesis protein